VQRKAVRESVRGQRILRLILLNIACACDIEPGLLEGLESCERGNTARTYLFLQMMRLGPANCSGGAAAFFLAIAQDDCLTAQDVVRKMPRYECLRALNLGKVWKCWWCSAGLGFERCSGWRIHTSRRHRTCLVALLTEVSAKSGYSEWNRSAL
jgi:hypothetical protein